MKLFALTVTAFIGLFTTTILALNIMHHADVGLADAVLMLLISIDAATFAMIAADKD